MTAAPFDHAFYLILDLAVGGTSGWFPDNVGGKMWFDGSSSAMPRVPTPPSGIFTDIPLNTHIQSADLSSAFTLGTPLSTSLASDQVLASEGWRCRIKCQTRREERGILQKCPKEGRGTVFRRWLSVRARDLVFSPRHIHSSAPRNTIYVQCPVFHLLCIHFQLKSYRIQKFFTA
ncbi:hypothetical protein A0H81_08997 [Grifola frondosa]|uniref:Uncharacterized protein n=1 Tax=Grifola frondosa TaxID=5627 RepID=A0A1C7M1Z4_GRIFR|nr:hypothetical protein A0H81_08997 [Grifola frondosa]